MGTPRLEQHAVLHDVLIGLLSEPGPPVVSTRVPKGDHFYLEGDRCKGFAVVCTGRLRVYKVADSGREITLYEVREKEACIVCTLSVVLDAPAAASALAETDVEVLFVRADTFRRLMSERETLRNAVLRSIAERMVEVITLVEEVAFRRLDRRLASALLGRIDRSAADRDGVVVTHQDLALELGATREAISRILGDFEHRGVVALRRGRVVVTDSTRLRVIAEGTTAAPATDR